MCFCGRVTATDDPCKYDEDDPDDRRKSQVLMMAKLDEIEKVRLIRRERLPVVLTRSHNYRRPWPSSHLVSWPLRTLRRKPPPACRPLPALHLPPVTLEFLPHLDLRPIQGLYTSSCMVLYVY